MLGTLSALAEGLVLLRVERTPVLLRCLSGSAGGTAVSIPNHTVDGIYIGFRGSLPSKAGLFNIVDLVFGVSLVQEQLAVQSEAFWASGDSSGHP